MPKSKTNTPRKRTYARNRVANARASVVAIAEPDSTYFLKLVIVVILGTLWIKFTQPMSWQGIPMNGFPFGMLVGLAGIRLLEKNPFDRRIWYAVLIVVGIISFFVPAGIVI